MRVFFGIQATGNGHITRARALAPKLRAAGVDVTYLFTGRPREQLFEMEAFGDFRWLPGLTFATRRGKVRYLRTAMRNPLRSFLKDVRSLDLSGYDLVVTDFEPVTSWAARRQRIPTIGIGHQYAFDYAIPKTGETFLAVQVMKRFAPATIGLGVHWHHFNQPLLPPVIETNVANPPRQEDKIIVYLPFEEVPHVVSVLKHFPLHQFHVYSAAADKAGPACRRFEHIHIKPLSREGFQSDFADAAGVICNSGFELSSEALLTGKKLLVKPLHGQMEQLSNALAIELLRFGQVMHSLDGTMIKNWLNNAKPVRVRYPDVAQRVVDWFLAGDWRVTQPWIDGIWDSVVYE